MNFNTQATTPMIAMLTNLKAWLNAAKQHSEERDFDPNNWLQTRLIVDMFPLVKQVQIACDFAKNTHGRLLAIETPTFDDNETTLAQIIDRIDKTIELLKIYEQQNPPSDWEIMPIQITLKSGKVLDFTGLTYLNSFTLPAFYFHIMTCYNLLRANGVKLGKADYFGYSLQL